MSEFTSGQRAPDKNEDRSVPVFDLVMADLAQRRQMGRTKYGTELHTHNGRDPMIDAYQESLDLCMYFRQALYEKYGR